MVTKVTKWSEGTMNNKIIQHNRFQLKSYKKCFEETAERKVAVMERH